MFESIFGFLAIAVVVDGIVKMYKIRLSHQESQQVKTEVNTELLARLDKLERRVGNLETIVLESEKHREFERAL